MNALIVGAVAAALSALFVRISIPLLLRAQLIDRPTARSSHEIPTPRGGGAGLLLAAALAAVGGAYAFGPSEALMTTAALFGLAGALAALCVIDDARSLSAGLRLTAQAACVAVGLATIGPDPAAVFAGLLPSWAAAAIVALGWMWFVNLFNFMDGIDGIAGGQAAVIGGAIGAGALIGVVPVALAAPSLAIAGAACGFLAWNWAPARVFMGDVGSAPLGFLLGWLMLQSAAAGAPALALLPAMLFLVDATATLLKRLMRREAVWRAHREHAYQRAARAFGGHAPVARRFILAGAALSSGALALEIWSSAAAGLGAIAAGAVIGYVGLERMARG